MPDEILPRFLRVPFELHKSNLALGSPSCTGRNGMLIYARNAVNAVLTQRFPYCKLAGTKRRELELRKSWALDGTAEAVP